ncbi:MAG: DUF1640 domain-containing protein [Alphaproteobacteria bacterium]|nr:DUF1640 domain-containing protein [Alphaproteobacteria bacterium]
MSTITFDTLKLARKLEASGFTAQQAAGAAEAVSESVAEVSGLATKSDIELAKHELKIWTAGMAGVIIAFLPVIKLFGH